jgi:hypothetical protein
MSTTGLLQDWIFETTFRLCALLVFRVVRHGLLFSEENPQSIFSLSLRS